MNKQQPECQEQPNPPSSNGLSVAEALEFYRGWAAARKGDPYDVGEGSLWIEGFVTYKWLRGIPGRHRMPH